MIRNYFKIAWRNIKKHSFYSGINILGLFAGLTFSLLISAYVWGEMQINKTLKNTKQQYMLISEWKKPNMGLDFTTLGPLSKRLKEDYPDLISNYYRWDGVTSIISKDGNNFREDIQLGDSTLLSMYDFKLLHGNKKNALTNPYSVVITADKAIKYFGKTNVIGETISIQSFSGDKHDFNITGVLKEIPKNSVTQINDNNLNSFFIPTNTYSYFGRTDFDSWTNIYIPSYIELKEGVSIKDLEVPIQKLIEQNASERIAENLKINPILLTDFYLQKDNALVKRMLFTLSFVGLFILLMAIVNFINISMSKSSSRIREVGIRKVLGSLRKQLIFQFLVESFIMVLLATILALITFSFLRPLFSQIVGVQIPELISLPLYFVFILIALIVTVSLLAGLYPAFVLSSLKSVNSLKGKLKTTKENVIFRKSLVGFQFSIALVVLISAVIVTQQVNYFFGQDLGFNKEYILSAQVPRDWSLEGVQKMEIIRDEFEKMPQISNVSLSYEIPNGNTGAQIPIYKYGSESTQAITMQSLVIDPYYLETYKIPLKAGSYFNSIIDSSKIVLNEKAVLALGWKNPEDAIGKQLKILNNNNNDIVYTVQGVTNDFHFGSMHKQIQPIISFDIRTVNIYRYLSFRIKPDNINSTIDIIQNKWLELIPGSSFEYNFMDETLKKLYASEIQLKKATYNASLLSLIIVLLGIIGLVSLSIHKRIKEIGIRKVLGASLPNIIVLFLKEFTSAILIACIIAIPLSYIIMKDWLNNYVYSINITSQPFIFSIVILVTVTLLLIGLLTWRTANSNPIKSLRTE